MSAKHTPGPWFVGKITQKNLVQVVVRDGREEYSICDLWGDVFGEPDTNLTPEQKANARLVAAAPEMLEALEYVLGHPRAAFGTGDTPHAERAEMQRLAEAAIRKARGKQ